MRDERLDGGIGGFFKGPANDSAIDTHVFMSRAMIYIM